MPLDFQPRAHQFEGLLQPRLDDADQQRFRRRGWPARFFLADLRHVDDLALVGGVGDGAAVQRLHPLGMRQRRRQAARDVVGHVAAADRHAVGVDHLAVEEDGDGRGAAAHVDHGDAELHLVLDQGGEAGGVGRDDEALDVQVAARDAGRRGCATAPAAGGDDVHAGRRACRRTCRAGRGCRGCRRSSSRPGWSGSAPGRRCPGTGAPGPAPGAHRRRRPRGRRSATSTLDGLRGRLAAGEVDHHLADRLPRHLLGRMDGGADSLLRRVHVDDGAGPETP